MVVEVLTRLITIVVFVMLKVWKGKRMGSLGEPARNYRGYDHDDAYGN